MADGNKGNKGSGSKKRCTIEFLPVITKCSQDARVVVDDDNARITGQSKITLIDAEEVKLKYQIDFNKGFASDLLAEARDLVGKLKKGRLITSYLSSNLDVISGKYLSVDEVVVYKATITQVE